MRVGRITRVDGVKAVATFYERLQPFLITNEDIVTSPRINSFVKTNVSLDTVICQIVGEHEIEYGKGEGSLGEHQEPQGPFQVDLEVRGYLANGNFKSGLRCLPIVGGVVETLSRNDLSLLHDSNVPHAMLLGNDLFDESSLVEINANHLMAGHIGIFGNTGSGKSNTLAKVLRQYALQFDRKDTAARIIIFDLNNEYGGDAVIPLDEKTVFSLNTRQPEKSKKIPFCIKDLDDDNWGTLLRATQKTQMPVVTRAYRRWKDFDGSELINRLKWDLVDKRATVFHTLRNYCKDYFEGLDDLAFNPNPGCETFYYQPWSARHFIDGISDVRSIALKSDLTEFETFYICLAYEVARSAESGTNFDYVQPLLPRAKQVIKDLSKVFENAEAEGLKGLFAESNFVVVQLGNTNSDTRSIIPALLVELLFDEAVEAKGDGKPSFITTAVIDEAHNLLSYDSTQNDLVHDNTLRVFEKVIKEGRKFGLFLCAASQRPSDISPTITSQLHNFFIHKLVNPNDIERIRKTVSFMGDSSLSMLSALGQGECILTGPALHMPQYIYVHQLESEYKPNSDDVVIFGREGLIKKRRLKKKNNSAESVPDEDIN